MTRSGQRITVIGAGGHAKVVVSTLEACGHDVVGIVDDDTSKVGQEILGVPVLGAPEDHRAALAEGSVVAIGANARRRELVRRFPEVAFVSCVHPTAWVHASVSIGTGAVIFAGAIVQPDTRIGAHAIVNTAASIDHDCVIGDYAHLAPGVRVAGGVHVLEGALLGGGSVVKPGARLGAWCTVGAGAAVVTDVAEGATVVGVPARPTETVH